MFNQIFCIKGSKGKFWHGYQERGYLPPLEPPEEKPQPEERPLVRGFDWQQQVEEERINVRKKLSEVLLEIDRLKVKVDRGSKQYKY